MLFPMEIIFDVHELEEGGYVAKAPSHSIVAQGDTWETLRKSALQAARLHFDKAPVRPTLIRLHLVKDEAIEVRGGDAVRLDPFESWIKGMDPTLTTAPELQEILVELSSREPIFHRPEFGTTRADFECMTVEDYWETGASGRRYSRQFVLDGLEERFSSPHADVWETSEFQCRKLGEDTYLLTYTLLQDRQRLTRRSTIWQKTPGGWKIVYHQGTIVQDA